MRLRYWLLAIAVVLLVAGHGLFFVILARKLLFAAIGSGILVIIVLLHAGFLAPVWVLLRKPRTDPQKE